ncbi:MAG TPA: dihydroxyacetone kinase subunit DhaL [Anaerolineae bacterium]|nr:dihydroxyacetone kinase subunit L [Anaerolineae bacterium]MCB0222956.1 dihydroxyacetone kinase subunit L [Anaerolineae bacterium]MCB9106645.1 dihydroxyacetone kinase subunit L [Anaerolineales bacterium]HRV93749.1 dihydroxyacetone kinase subunit DhaL [Anaerolineae bacterium]
MADNSLATTELIIQTMGEVALENRKYFSELDGVVGDGDFGNSLATGFEAVTVAKWDDLNRTDPGTFLKDVAQTFMGNVGGVTGSIWGTAFLRAGIKAGDKQELTTEDVLAMIRFAIEGMKKRGKSDLGDKTLLDAFIPATDEFEKIVQNGGTTLDALKGAAEVARQKTEEIKPWVAKRGRASYTGERSCNTYDAGSIAVAIMAERLVDVWEANS